MPGRELWPARMALEVSLDRFSGAKALPVEYRWRQVDKCLMNGT